MKEAVWQWAGRSAHELNLRELNETSFTRFNLCPASCRQLGAFLSRILTTDRLTVHFVFRRIPLASRSGVTCDKRFKNSPYLAKSASSHRQGINSSPTPRSPTLTYIKWFSAPAPLVKCNRSLQFTGTEPLTLRVLSYYIRSLIQQLYNNERISLPTLLIQP